MSVLEKAGDILGKTAEMVVKTAARTAVTIIVAKKVKDYLEKKEAEKIRRIPPTRERVTLQGE